MGLFAELHQDFRRQLKNGREEDRQEGFQKEGR
jgi:hypothetical protein